MILKLIKKWLFNKHRLYYIGKHDVLPPPLNKEEERGLLYSLKAGNTKARDELIEHNLRLVVYVAKKYDNVKNCNMEDIISIGTIGLVKAINTFDIEKNIKLATYASRCIENEILMFLRKNSKLRLEVSFDEPLNVDYDGNELLLSDIIGTKADVVQQEMTHNYQKRLFYHALENLNEREQLILKMRYGLTGYDEFTQKDVAEILGISQSYISRIEKKIIKKLRNHLNNDE